MGGSMNRGDILEARDGKAKRDAEVAQGQRGAAGSFEGRRMPGAPIDRTAQRSQSFDRSRSTVREPSGGATGGLIGGFGGGGGGAPVNDAAKARANELRFADQPVDGLAAAGTGDDANAADSAAATKPALTEAQRDQLVRVLDRRLVFLALARAVGEEARIAELASELGVPLADGRVNLALKVAVGADGSIPSATLDALRALGAEINAEVAATDARRGLVVIRIPATRLLELSAMPGLKRAEPILPS
jgi:hypothetical protein